MPEKQKTRNSSKKLPVGNWTKGKERKKICFFT